MSKKKLSAARSEAEEARWIEENEDRLLDLFERAAKEGALRIGKRSIGLTVSKESGTVVKPPSQKVMLRVPAEDLERARRIAAGKGIGYQTYMKMLLREGLDREERRA